MSDNTAFDRIDKSLTDVSMDELNHDMFAMAADAMDELGEESPELARFAFDTALKGATLMSRNETNILLLDIARSLRKLSGRDGETG